MDRMDRMDVRTLALVTGQELVFDFCYVDTNTQRIHVKSPMVFQSMTHPKTGQTVSGFGNWPALFNGDDSDTVQIPISAVLLMPVKPLEDVQRAYISTVTGLEIPATPKILVE